MFVDYIMNGAGHGAVGEALGQVRFDPGLLRPYLDENNVKCCTVNTGRVRYDEKRGKHVPIKENVRVKDLVDNGIWSPVFNSATTLRKEEWIQLDNVVLLAARKRLKAWADLARANSYGISGMTKMVLEHETMSDPGEALVDMEGLADSITDTPRFQLEALPLPITHSGFWYSQRRLSVSRSSGTPLDTTMGEACGRRVAEKVEKTTIGVTTGVTYGTSAVTSGYGRTSAVYGYTNFSSRLTKTDFTVPTGSNPEATVQDFLEAREQLYSNNFYGPFMVYHSTDWDQYLDNDYARLGGNNMNMTLRDRLKKIEGIMDVQRLDFLTSSTNPFTMIFVQMTSDVARAVNGLDLTTVQWEAKGGMQLMFKVICIYVPQLRADFNGNCGILEATTS
jgi:Family of unknown function (DUF6260)